MSEQSVLAVDGLDVGEMDSHEDPGYFDKGQIVMATQLGQSISETARLVGCSHSGGVSAYQQWSKEGQTTNRQQGIGHSWLINEQGQRRLKGNRKTTEAQVIEIFASCG